MVQSFFTGGAAGTKTVTGTLRFTILTAPLPASAALLIGGVALLAAAGAIGRRRARPRAE